MSREPVVMINAIVAVIEAAILLGVGFGLSWSPEQIAAVMGFVLALGFVAQTLWARSQVTPTADPHDNQGRELVPAEKGRTHETTR